MAEGATLEMTKEHRALLSRNIIFFSKNLELTSNFYAHLEQHYVITERMYNNIKVSYAC